MQTKMIGFFGNSVDAVAQRSFMRALFCAGTIPIPLLA